MTTREGKNNRGTLTRTTSNSRTTEQRREMLGDEGGDKETQIKKAQDNGNANNNNIDGRTTRARAGRQETRRTTNRDRNHDNPK
jgi:hypothetical protein